MNCSAILKEIDIRTNENESFRGTNVRFEKIRDYWKMKRACCALVQTAPRIKHMEDVSPGRDHRHAIIAVDMEGSDALTGSALALFNQMRSLADNLTVLSRGRLTRYSFIIMNVWED